MIPSDPIDSAIEDNLADNDLELDTLIPDSPNTPYDMHEVGRVKTVTLRRSWRRKAARVEVGHPNQG